MRFGALALPVLLIFFFFLLTYPAIWNTIYMLLQILQRQYIVFFAEKTRKWGTVPGFIVLKYKGERFT